MVYNWLHLLFPDTCLICGLKGVQNLDICTHCRANLPRNRSFCRCCALPLTTEHSLDLLCGPCAQTRAPFTRIIAPWLYKPPIDDLIQQLKFNQKLPMGRLLAQLLAREIPGIDYPALLLPVPQHNRQLTQRGFNHSSELTRVLSCELGIPWSPWLLRKTRETLPQHSLGKKERRKNLHRCFNFDNRDRHRHIAVIDDVVTTGTTAVELAKTLKRAGVEQVEIWALARTPLKGSS